MVVWGEHSLLSAHGFVGHGVHARPTEQSSALDRPQFDGGFWGRGDFGKGMASAVTKRQQT